MDPSSIRHRIASLSRPKQVFWVASLALGAWLGYVIAANLRATGSAVFNAIFAVAIALGILAVLAGVALILALVPDKSGRPAARAAVIGGVLLALGVALGRTITPVFVAEYRDPVTREARGTMTLTLEGVEGYAGRLDAPAICRSEVDMQEVAFVETEVVGTIGAVVVAASATITSYAGSDFMVRIVPAAGDSRTAPTWQGPEGIVEQIVGDRDGRIVFTGARMTARDEAGLAPEGWPEALSGTISWSCGEWLPT